LISLNQFNNGFTGTKWDSSGRIISDSSHPAQVVAKDQVRFIAGVEVEGRRILNAGKGTVTVRQITYVQQVNV